MPHEILRFRPTRAGVIGLWDYTDTTFAFADGRLVLRGANGSGKTKALEVLFPFVLDGRLDARRLDPFSGENRTMKENLLWRGGDTGHAYAWLEFAQRLTGDAAAAAGSSMRHVTVGVGLQAQRHRPVPRSWFFVADGRVGQDIVLVDGDGRPRTKRALADDLGEGIVLDRAGDHRRRVDDVLFGLGAERYEAMLDLVLTLRRPMLAKDLDPRLLSETLTRGLRPLDDELIEQVARSFDDLEAVQRDLDRLVVADEAARAFVTDYRGYLRTQARSRADAAIEAGSALAAAVARRDAATRQLDEARAAEAMSDADAHAAATRLAEARARRDGLRSSDAFRTAGQLEHLERSVRDLRGAADAAQRRAEQAAAAAASSAGEREQAAHQRSRADAEVARLRPRVTTSAVDAGAEWSDTDGDGSPAEVRRRLGARTSSRRADLDAVRELLRALDDAERRVAVSDAAAARAETIDDDAERALAEAGRAVAEARATLGDELHAWAARHPEVVEDTDRDALLAAVPNLGDEPTPDAPGTDPTTLSERWHERLEPRRAQANAQHARHEGAMSSLREQAAALSDRRQAILDERDDAPPAVPWRGDRRDRREGAPLWRLVRFADTLSTTEAAGLEAALEAAGLLDAWIRPDGTVAQDAIEAYLSTGGSRAGGDRVGGDSAGGDSAGDDPSPGGGCDGDGDAGRTLLDVLVPEESSEVPGEVVTRILRSIPLASGDGTLTGGGEATVLAIDGRYRLGPLHGTHRVTAPRYVGATARAAHRASRVAGLDAELAALDEEIAAVERAAAAVRSWLDAARAAIDQLPSSRPLLARLRERDRASGRRQQSREALDAARAAAETARREVNERRSSFQREARGRALPTTAEGIAEVSGALDRFTADGAELVAALELATVRAEAAARADERAQRAASAASAAADEATERREQHDARTIEFTTLRDRMGADVRDVLEELDEVEGSITTGEGEQARLADAARAAAAARGQAEGELNTAGEALATAEQRLDGAASRLAVLARPDLAVPLGLELPGDASPTVLLEAIDAVATGISGDETRRKAAQTRVLGAYEQLQHRLGAGYQPSWDIDDDVIVVTVADDLGSRSVAGFADGLATQRAEQESLLTARERALFEDALLTSVCAQIHGRTQATRELVATMDLEMRERQMSSGQTVGVAWRADDGASPEWKQVHRLLDQDPAHFGPDQLEALRRHFSLEIKAARATDPRSSYRELLAEVLDYRRWRRFELFLVEADGRQALLTKARHARLSGGEKAASLHLPLFAAAHAAFAAAAPDAPRLLGLDEAFAGIDDQGRSELLSLTVAFDLDLFMTGYDLWAIDRSVPGVAHYDLLHLADEHVVSSLLVLWNGRELVEGPDAERALVRLGAEPDLGGDAP